MGGVLKTVAKVLISPVGTILGAFDNKSAPSAPPPGPVVMPLADDAKVQQAKKRAAADALTRGGRTSTMLTDTSDTLGGS